MSESLLVPFIVCLNSVVCYRWRGGRQEAEEVGQVQGCHRVLFPPQAGIYLYTKSGRLNVGWDTVLNMAINIWQHYNTACGSCLIRWSIHSTRSYPPCCMNNGFRIKYILPIKLMDISCNFSSYLLKKVNFVNFISYLTETLSTFVLTHLHGNSFPSH